MFLQRNKEHISTFGWKTASSIAMDSYLLLFYDWLYVLLWEKSSKKMILAQMQTLHICHRSRIDTFYQPKGIASFLFLQIKKKKFLVNTY